MRVESPMKSPSPPEREALANAVQALSWYHTIDLGQGVVTPGIYDHRPCLGFYGIPADLYGKTALDVGAASGFFSFEMERRGARVTAVDLPAWFDHDFGPRYQPDQTPASGLRYLREPFNLARQALGSQVEKREASIYELTPEIHGVHDLVFCGSLLLHLTDPIRALWRLRAVTGELAIIATVIHPTADKAPLALYSGHQAGFVWWLPNRPCLEAMLVSAGFSAVEWYSEFQLNYRGQDSGPYHAVVHAWNTEARTMLAPPSPWRQASAFATTTPEAPRPVGLRRWLRRLFG